MLFSSQLFLYLFLPLFLATYYLCPQRFRSAHMLLFSYVFYGWWRPDFLGLLIGVTVVSYYVAAAVEAAAVQNRKRWLAVGVTANLAALGYFKYANFGIDSLNALLTAAGFDTIGWTRIVLPIGLSFYIFQAISYIIDVYRKTAPPARNFVDFAAFIALFPQLVAGPVLRYHDLAEQFYVRTYSWERFSRGSMIFMVGFCMKVLIADTVAPLVDAAFALQAPTLADAWIGALAYTIQLFFDFAGYSTMAIGMALMIGFVFMENFNDPYVSRSITEFWKRWHISLSNWLREYLYISLGGNRKGRLRTYINLFLTMLLGGIWHGANWTFVLWGMWHGAVLAFERYWEEKFGPSRLPVPIQVARTMLLVIIGWVMFRATTVDGALQMYAGMLGFNGIGMSDFLMSEVTTDRVAVLIFAFLLVYAMPWIKRNGENLRWVILPLFAWAVATLSAQSFSPFLYFQF